MNKVLTLLILAGWIFAPWACPRAESAAPSPAPAAHAPAGPLTYESFRLVHTRNVFDPDRRPLRPGSASSSPVTRADYAALTGTLLNADKTYAFFSGSRPEFNRVLTVREKIANATITGITGLNIEIERDGKRTTIAVGQTVPFDNQTAPGVPPADDPAISSSPDGAAPGSVVSATSTPATARPTAGSATATATKGSPANLDEIRRRMMEKRQQELK